MNDIYLIYDRLQDAEKIIENTIYMASADDDCTDCYKQGLERALEACDDLFTTIEKIYADRLQDDKLISNAVVSEGQLPLF